METTKHDEEFLTLDHPVTASAGGTTWRTTQSKHNQLDTYQMYTLLDSDKTYYCISQCNNVNLLNSSISNEVALLENFCSINSTYILFMRNF